MSITTSERIIWIILACLIFFWINSCNKYISSVGLTQATELCSSHHGIDYILPADYFAHRENSIVSPNHGTTGDVICKNGRRFTMK